MKRVIASLLALGMVTGAAFAQGLTVWTTFNNPTLDYLQQDVADFAAAFGVEVEVVKLDINELKQQMLLSAPQGQAGDVIVGIPHDQMAEMAVGGVLADLSNAATEGYLSDLGEQSRLAFTYNGRLFGLPLFVEGPALLYNRDLVTEIPATYERFIELSQELTTSDTFGFLYDINNFYFSYGWLHTFGGYVFGRTDGTLDATDVGLANEGAVRGGQELQALRFEHGIVPAGTNYDVANGLFIDGALAMFYTGPWAVGQAREAGIDVGVAPMPPLADGTPWSGFMGVQGVLVNEFSERGTDAVNLGEVADAFRLAAGLRAARGTRARLAEGSRAGGRGPDRRRLRRGAADLRADAEHPRDGPGVGPDGERAGRHHRKCRRRRRVRSRTGRPRDHGRVS
ncbi:MAG: extracellular solute-binding protein [Trueperaceae bacterium]|nr:extracellular solute-binding protein [Trueperaceae bacterium]